MMENETEYLQPIIGTLHLERFRPLSTFNATLFLLLLTCCLEVVAIFFFVPLHFNSFTKCDVVYILLYSQCGYWCVTLILDHYYKLQHHYLRLDGHFEFHDKIVKYVNRPFYITSFWNTVFLLTIGALYNKHADLGKICSNSALFSEINLLPMILTFEVIMLLPLYITYALCVHDYNKSRPVPDVEKRECWTLEDSLSAGEVGYSCNGEAIADLLQKQADLIYYYKCLNEVLNVKIMELLSQRRGKD